MNWSDETVEAVARSIERSMQNARIYNTINDVKWTAYSPEAKEALAAVAECSEVIAHKALEAL